MTGSLYMLVPVLYWGGLVGLLASVLGLLAWVMAGNLRGEGEAAKVGRNSTEDLLRDRFARGEIDAEVYERALEVLRARYPDVNDDS